MARKILLADDSVTAQSMGRRILTEAGYEVVTVNNGSAALKKIAEHPPDLLVLDVYMPGYGGLEVCQRLKNASETAAIPVLLTVGKLEPFKADEARRVQADAYLVKPFEASELIAALIKLEDKIVPKAETLAPASFAKALAAMEQSSATTQDSKFGDTHTGWKERLRIPHISKPDEPQEGVAEPARADAMAFRDFPRPQPTATEPVDAPSAVESTVAGGLLQGITADEIAAISAAAEALGQAESVESAAEPTAAAAPPESAGPVAAELPQMELPDTELADTVTESAQPESPFAAIEEIAASVDASLDSLSQAEASSETAVQSDSEPGSEVTEPGASGALSVVPQHPEVAPVAGDGEGIMDAIWRQTEDVVDTTSELAAIAAIPESSAAAEPLPARWIAEEVPVPEDEASILEQEMRKAYAAMADESALAVSTAETEPVAERAAPVELANTDSAVAPASEVLAAESAASPELGSTMEGPVSPEDLPQPVAVEETETAAPEAPPVVAVEEVEPADLAQSLPVAAEEEVRPATQIEALSEAEPVAAAAAPTAECSSEPAPLAEMAEPGTAPVEAVASESLPEPALAAAASAAAGGSAFAVSNSMVAAETESAQASAEGSAPVLDETAVQHEAELAAAWAQWREIRETVAGPEMTSQLAEVAAAGLQEPQSGALDAHSAMASHSEAEADYLPVSASNPEAIASIVDSVLAELKPRLVEEIAKKLGQKK